MSNEFVIRYSLGWFWKKYWIVFDEQSVVLFDNKRVNSIEIPYKEISHVFKQPLSLDQIDIYCTVDILEGYLPNNLSWFPPKPLINPKVYMFSIHSFKRNDIMKSFIEHGVKTSIDHISIKNYWEDIRKKMQG